MEHKAFAFRWHAYEQELRPKLVDALASGNCKVLIKWINQNREQLTDPYEGAPLPEDWQNDFVESEIPEDFGEFALTKFYDPTDSHGLGYEWLQIAERFSDFTSQLLGTPENSFDPGKLGSYFLTPPAAAEAVFALRNVPNDSIQEYSEFLSRCSSGVYITF